MFTFSFSNDEFVSRAVIAKHALDILVQTNGIAQCCVEENSVKATLPNRNDLNASTRKIERRNASLTTNTAEEIGRRNSRSFHFELEN